MAPSRADEMAVEEGEAFIQDRSTSQHAHGRNHTGYPHYLNKSWSTALAIFNTIATMTGVRRRRNRFGSKEESRQALQVEPKSSTKLQKGWRGIAAVTLKRLGIGSILILVIFGILHIMQIIMGSGRLFWDLDDGDDFLPDWGRPGHQGQYLAHYATDATRDVLPIPCHSHNDYWRRIPLFEAIHYGCTGVEADVWLKDGDLFVGHSKSSLTRNRTFRSLYVDPLVELLDKQNPTTEFVNSTRNGVFDEDAEQTLVLLVDFKTDGPELWPHVVDQLSSLRDRGYLTYFDGEKTIPGAITVVATGNAPFDHIVANTTYRDIFFDAPLDRLSDPETAKDFNPGTSYYASVSFAQTLGKVRKGHFTPAQMEMLRVQISSARQRGLKSRYWDTPSWPIGLRNHIWTVLVKEGAEVLNVDDLAAAAKLDWRKHRDRRF